MELKEKIIELSKACGPSGFEDEPRDILDSMCRQYCDAVWTDTMGNLIVLKKCGKENARKLMLCAHMDEIGQIVTGSKKGFLRFAQIGGVDQRMLPACEMKVMTDPPVFGVTAVMPPHALKKEEQDKAVPADEIYLDIGDGIQDGESFVPLGTPIVYATEPFEMENGFICGKALDDRACCAITAEIMEIISRENIEVDVYALFSVQEEIGSRGAVTAAYDIQPDYCIVMDVTFGDQPDAEKTKTVEMCKGPAIAKGPNVNKNLCNMLCACAASQNMSFQFEIIPGNSGTDGWAIQVSRSGVATALVSLPLRYMHTPSEVINMRDAEDIVKLVSGFILNYGGEL